MGEAILFFDRPLGKHFMYLQKQAMQTLSKMRFINELARQRARPVSSEGRWGLRPTAVVKLHYDE